jgi:hypothetical protein
MKTDVMTTGFSNADTLADALRPWQRGRAQVLNFTATHDRLTSS